MMRLELYVKPLRSIADKFCLVSIYHIYVWLHTVSNCRPTLHNNTASFKLVPETSATVYSQYHYNHNQTHSFDIVGSHRLPTPMAGPQAVGGSSTIMIHDPNMTCMMGSRAVRTALGRSVSSECRPR
jgi:hypothetical protein